jgi:tetratricopeptide (TPR) repeat protein
VFEDLQWADAALLDFIEHLLDWSRDHPLFVLTLARPDLLERRATWGTRGRSFTSLALDPLPDEAMDQLLEGLVPGIPSDLRERIRERAEGIPLYAVETVRMILDRGLLERDGDRYRATANIEDLAVPETLHTLIAARLDALSPSERSLVLDASVLGKTFTRQGLGVITGLPEPELDAALEGLVRKELLSLQSDPRSPERGQYGFLQGLVKDVAYHTLSKKERRARHLAVARYLERNWTGDEDEIIEVMASHYVEAYRAKPDASDADEIRASAREMLGRAGERAASLGASGEAQRHFEQAMEFADEAAERAGLTERAGVQALAAGDSQLAEQHFDQAIAQFESQGETHAAARVSAHLAEVLWDAGHIEEGIERMERAYEVLADDEPDEDFAALSHQLGRMHFFAGNLDECAERTERALEVAEALWIPEVLSHALNTKSLVLLAGRHFVEADALLRKALDLAVEYDLPLPAFRAYFNLYVSPRVEEVEAFARHGLALARRRGNRQWEANFLGRLAEALWMRGDWDGAVECERELLDAGERVSAFGLSRTLAALAHLHVNRGEVDVAERLVAMRESARGSAGVIERLDYHGGRSIVARARGDHEEARRATAEVVAVAETLGTAHETVREGLLQALELEFEQGELDRAEALIATMTSQSPRNGYLHVMLSRFRARLYAARGEVETADQAFSEAARTLRDYGTPFALAAALLEHAELLVSAGRGEETTPLLAEAREIFERLRATPWLERLLRAEEAAGVAPLIEA